MCQLMERDGAFGPGRPSVSGMEAPDGRAGHERKGLSLHPGSAPSVAAQSRTDICAKLITFVICRSAQAPPTRTTLSAHDSEPNALELLLLALGSCLASGIHANAIARHIEVTSLSLELKANVGRFGPLGD